jgi:hypothetical protein
VFEGCGDAELLALMGDAQQAERVAFARQLMAVGRFAQRRVEQMSGENDFFCVDDWEVIAAEIGAELGISRGRASSQMRYGTTLPERFPKLGEVFLAGRVDFRVIAATIFRTDLITDAAVLAEIDVQLARKAPSWNKLSREKVTELVDWMVIEADPEAVRVARQRDLDRHIEVQPGQNGMAEIWGSVRPRCGGLRYEAERARRDGVPGRCAHQDPAPRRCADAVGCRRGLDAVHLRIR